MPKTKLESIVFTAITAWMMVYLMTLYNIVLASGTFVNATFLTALKTMWVEFVLIFLCAYFISSHMAKYFAFQVVKPTDRPSPSRHLRWSPRWRWPASWGFTTGTGSRRSSCRIT